MFVQESECVNYLAHDAVDQGKVFADELSLFLKERLEAFTGHILNQNVEFVVFVAWLMPVGSDAHKVQVLDNTRVL